MKAPKVLIPLDFPMGLFLGAVSVAAVVVIGNAVTSPNWATVYAAVIGGLFAVVAVWGALYGVSLQVRAQAELLDQQRLARLEAERAALPMALVDVVYCCLRRVNYLVLRDGDWKNVNWTVSREALETIKACIEYAGDETRVHLVDLLAIYQMCLTGTDTVVRQWPDAPSSLWDVEWRDGENKVRNIFDWASLHARAICLMRFARGETHLPGEDEMKRLTIHLLKTTNERRPSDDAWRGRELITCKYFASEMAECRKSGNYGWSSHDWRKQVAYLALPPES